MRDVLASLREFFGKVARRWYAFGIGVIGALLGLASTLYAQARPKAAPLVPMWLWLTLLAGGFLVAILWAFHDVRMERDAMRAEMKDRFSAMRYALQISGSQRTMLPGPDTFGVQFEVTLTNQSGEFMRYEVERVSTAIEGRPEADALIGGSSEAVIAPHGASTFTCPPAYGIPAGWRTGVLKLTARYGHPSEPPQYRVQWEYALQNLWLAGSLPGQASRVRMTPVRPVEVEDILSSELQPHHRASL